MNTHRKSHGEHREIPPLIVYLPPNEPRTVLLRISQRLLAELHLQERRYLSAASEAERSTASAEYIRSAIGVLVALLHGKPVEAGDLAVSYEAIPVDEQQGAAYVLKIKASRTQGA